MMKKMSKEKETKMEEMMADEETEPKSMRKNKKYLKTSTGYMKKGK